MLDNENQWPPEPTAPVIEVPPRRKLPIFIKVGGVLNLLAIMATAPAYVRKLAVYYDPERGGIAGWLFGITVAICVLMTAGAIASTVRGKDKRAWLGVALCLLPIGVVYGMLAFAPNFDLGPCGCGPARLR